MLPISPCLRHQAQTSELSHRPCCWSTAHAARAGQVSQSSGSLQEDDMKTDTDDWADFQAALRWRPDPVEVDLLQAHKKESGTDIISMLVAIYGSKELFINEYR